MKIRPLSRYVFFAAPLAFACAGLCAVACYAQAPAAEPAAEAPAEPIVPLMKREFREIREYTGPDGEIIPIEENRRWLSAVNALKTSGKIASPEDQKLFDEYYRWRIAELTWLENLPKLADKRQRFKKFDLLPSGKASMDPTYHDKLNEKLLSVLQNIAKSDDYHPAVRTNCVLLLNELNLKEEGGPGDKDAVAIPLPQALPVLIGMINDAKQPDFVRIPALLGVVRHAEANLPPAARKDAVVPLLVAIVGSKEPIGAGDLGGHGWLRRRGAESIGAVAPKWPEANTPQVASALLALISDDDASLISRSEAAKSVGAIDRGVLNPNASTIAKAIGDAAVAIAVRGPVADTGKAGIDYLTYMYGNLLYGLRGEGTRGLQSAATDQETKDFLKDLIKRVDDMLSTASDKNLPEPTRIERLNSQGERLADWLKKAGVKLARGS